MFFFFFFLFSCSFFLKQHEDKFTLASHSQQKKSGVAWVLQFDLDLFSP